ncbi:hypothetical protein SERLA73DRAFT_155482 [Serpula lacrymans var. lacrymans S7.3]|uniref:Uncharacterized protein n=1 Tax=Serpula lacrymans var. lacrymans (strain S7.3) TaxID=936435 RepID=F8QAE6_SERL3|nr:hypothetical protein SERLA73DRAFT_155482 [Serpula lacrymans var. lacrymans S7.3]
MHSQTQQDIDITGEIDRISIRIDDLIVTRRRLEAKHPWNIKYLLKAFEMHRQRHIVLRQSSSLMKLAQKTSESILRRRVEAIEENESLRNTLSSFLTAAEFVAQAQNGGSQLFCIPEHGVDLCWAVDTEVEPEGGNDRNEATSDSETVRNTPQSPVNQDQGEESTLTNIYGFVRAILDTAPTQTGAPNITINMPLHIYQNDNIVVNQGPGSCSTPTVIVGGSDNRGGDQRLGIAPSQPAH